MNRLSGNRTRKTQHAIATKAALSQHVKNYSGYCCKLQKEAPGQDERPVLSFPILPSSVTHTLWSQGGPSSSCWNGTSTSFGIAIATETWQWKGPRSIPSFNLAVRCQAKLRLFVLAPANIAAAI
eukprot:5167931-Amphidinium_carterae.1